MDVLLMLNDRDACNARCKHCYLPYKGVRDENSAFLLTRELMKKNYKPFLAGAEILTNPKYLELFPLVHQKLILSNGILLTKSETIKLLKKYKLKEVELSHHFGIQKKINSIPFEITHKAAAKLKQANIDVHLGSMVCPENYKDINFMCSEAYRIGCSRIEFIRYIKSGTAKKEKRETLNQEQRIELYNLVLEARKEFPNLKIKLNGNFGPISEKGKALKNNYCPAGNSYYTISPDNIIYGCPFLMDFPLGRVNNNNNNDDYNNNKIEIIKSIDDYLPNEMKGRRDICLTDILIKTSRPPPVK